MIPDHAKKVFSGVRIDVFQWDQEMFDGSIGIFERASRAPSAGIIAIDGDQIILTDQEQPHKGHYIGLLGGVTDPGEEPIEAAHRELLEEAGMQSESMSLLYSQHVGLGLEATRYYFLARDCKVVADQSLDVGERIVLLRVSFEEFIDLVISEQVRGDHALREWLLLQHYQDGSWDGVRRLFFG